MSLFFDLIQYSKIIPCVQIKLANSCNSIAFFCILLIGGICVKKGMDDFKMSITDALELPLDVALDLPKIILVGNLKINITNHKGIIEYTNELIRINSKIGMIKITGKSLEIKNVLMEEITVNGFIEKVEIIS